MPTFTTSYSRSTYAWETSSNPTFPTSLSSSSTSGSRSTLEDVHRTRIIIAVVLSTVSILLFTFGVLRRQKLRERKQAEEAAAAAAAASGPGGVPDMQRNVHTDAGLLARGEEMPPPSYDSVPKDSNVMTVSVQEQGVISQSGSAGGAPQNGAPATGVPPAQRNVAASGIQENKPADREPAVLAQNAAGTTFSADEERALTADQLSRNHKTDAWWEWWKKNNSKSAG
jgi:hypothetical protein